MIVKDSQLHHQTEWPQVLTPEQREQLLKEKVARISAWYQHLKSNDHKDCEHS
jgi:Spy/CpxP family protein refolding chaperone